MSGPASSADRTIERAEGVIRRLSVSGVDHAVPRGGPAFGRCRSALRPRQERTAAVRAGRVQHRPSPFETTAIRVFRRRRRRARRGAAAPTRRRAWRTAPRSRTARPRVATFSAVSDIPLCRAASFNDISLSFRSSSALRCAGGNPATAARTSFRPNAGSSSIFAAAPAKVSSRESTATSFAARRSDRRCQSASRCRWIAISHGRKARPGS